MATGYIRQSSGLIVTGQTIQASHFNNEYNAIQAAFDATTGHVHDGTTGGGAKITAAGLGSLTSSSAGVVVADGANGLIVRTITGTANQVTVTNGTGVSGNPTLSLPQDIATTSNVTFGTITASANILASFAVQVGQRIRPGNAAGNNFVISARDVDGATDTTFATITSNNTPTMDLSDAVTKAGQYIYRASGTDVAVADGGTGASTAANARTNLGLVIGTDVQAYDADLDALAGVASAGMLSRTGAGTAAARTITGTSNRLTVTNGDGVSGNPTLDISTSYVGQATITTLGTITTGVWTGTAIAVANGGTGATTASTARTNLGVAIGSDVQAYDTTLDAFAAYNTNGIVTQIAADNFAGRTITGTANEITVTNGNGVAGNPTLSLPTALTFTSKTVTGGTFTGIGLTSSTLTSCTISGQQTIASSPGLTHASTTAGTLIFNIWDGVNRGFHVYAGSDGVALNGTNAVVKINQMVSTGRSINATGTVNASGSDVAEYIYKSADCQLVAKGQIVGFDSDGLIIDKYSLAKSFGVKSTQPNLVGGDDWGIGLTGEELETERQKVDRIAFCGRVPVNVYGANPGDYIVPVLGENDSITGIAVNPEAITFAQYKLAVGQVRKILPDNRAEIAVKVV